jgi:hypothetical protein
MAAFSGLLSRVNLKVDRTWSSQSSASVRMPNRPLRYKLYHRELERGSNLLAMPWKI